MNKTACGGFRNGFCLFIQCSQLVAQLLRLQLWTIVVQETDQADIYYNHTVALVVLLCFISKTWCGGVESTRNRITQT